jgi:hypothetical protein
MMWSAKQLARIGEAAELTLLVPRRHAPRAVPVWAVVRAHQGTDSWWYRGALARPGAGVRLGGQDVAVRFSPRADTDAEEIDDAYRRKYGRFGYVSAVLTTQAKAATLRVDPMESRS